MKNLNELVYTELAKIPKGSVVTYKELAKRVGVPKAVRRVATLVGKNPNPIIIPCHRVIRSDMTVGEYTYKGKRDQRKKINLLKAEGVQIENKRVIIKE